MMMAPEAIYDMLKQSGIPFAYRAWPEGHAPPLPWGVFLLNTAGSDNFAADGVVYYQVDSVQIELYTKYKDPETEAKVEKALAPHFWDKTETYLTDERCYQIIYEIEV